jgi:hypothetical protein
MALPESESIVAPDVGECSPKTVMAADTYRTRLMTRTMKALSLTSSKSDLEISG